MKIFGLIGYPLGHSFSRNFFNEKFHSETLKFQALMNFRTSFRQILRLQD